MSEASWGDEESAEPAKRRVPTWVWWGCGGGCLLLTLMGGAMAVFGWRLVSEGMDPEVQWPRLAQVLAFDRRPEGIELHFGSGLVGADQFVLEDAERGLIATVLQYPASAGVTVDLLDPELGLPLGLGKLIEPETGTLLVQGREVPCVRFAGIQRQGQGGAGVRLDLTGARKQPRTLELRRAAGAQRIEDAEVEAFLLPFDVWREP